MNSNKHGVVTVESLPSDITSDCVVESRRGKTVIVYPQLVPRYRNVLSRLRRYIKRLVTG